MREEIMHKLLLRLEVMAIRMERLDILIQSLEK
jgi:hypothetical protein